MTPRTRRRWHRQAHLIAPIVDDAMLTIWTQIRARRLAKLGTSTPPAASSSKADENKAPEPESTNPSPAETPIPETQQAEASRPKINITPAATSSSSSPNPFTKLGVKSSGQTEPSSSTGSFRVCRKRRASEIDDPIPAAPPAQRPNPQTESPEDYADRIFSQIFRISVNPHKMTTTQGHKLIFLPNLNEELNESEEPLKLTVDSLDQAIMEAASIWPHDKPLMAYLLPCWKRAVRASSTSKWTEGPKFKVHDEAKRLAMSSCLFSLTMPALYGSVFSSSFKHYH